MTNQALMNELCRKAQTLVLQYCNKEGDSFILEGALEGLVEDLDELDRYKVLNYAVYALMFSCPINEYEYIEYGEIEEFSPIEQVVNGITYTVNDVIMNHFALALNVDKNDDVMMVIRELAHDDFAQSPPDYKKEGLAKLIAQLQKVHDSL